MCIEPGALPARQRGLTILELLVFIVIVGAGLAGILTVMNVTVLHSADPLIRKQALAIAESLLEEIQLMPFTYCDPSSDSAAATATSVIACTTTPEAIGPETGETRYANPQFDNVNDYHGYNTALEVPTGIKDITGTPVAGLAGYNAAVTTTATALGGLAANDANGQAQVLLIKVTVTPPSGSPIVLEGYRTKYAPQATP